MLSEALKVAVMKTTTVDAVQLHWSSGSGVSVGVGVTVNVCVGVGVILGVLVGVFVFRSTRTGKVGPPFNDM